MARLTPEQETRLDDLAERRAGRIATRRQQLDAGEVTGHRVPMVYAGIAESERVLGVVATYEEDIVEARDRLGAAAKAYLDAVEAALDCDPWATAFRQVPETCQDGLVAAMLAAEESLLRELAATTHDLPDPGTWTGARTGFHPDQYALAQVLADAGVASVEETHCREAAERFADAPEPLVHYVDGVVAVARGLGDGERHRVETGLDSLVTYHEERRHPDNVVDAVLAPEATGLAWLATHQGYDCAVDGEFVPRALVTG